MMAVVQKDNWYLMALLILFFPEASEQLKSKGSTVKLEEGMLLNCSCPWSGKLIMVSWTNAIYSTPIAIYHPDYGVNFHSAYDGRVEFIKASALDGSIRVTNVTEKDEGVYHCSVQTFPGGSWSKETRVEKRVNITNIPTVLAHNPKTRLIVPESETVTIDCSHAGIVYEVSVEKMEGADGGSSLLAVCKQDADGVKLIEYLPSGNLNCSDEMELKLRLNNVSQDDGGMYRCNFSTDAGISSNLVMLVMFPSPKGLSGAQYTWYIYTGGGVAGALILVTVALLLLWRSRRKGRRLEYRTRLCATKRQKWRNDL
ncbi:CD226 antigen isoform X2 [Silurus meridionalis]|uniref:CD226 antigen isoform X2 n=1 Tax=Silurus meridionalis TaxID=175797 RepID=UPI001EEAFB06|nr:CD226 antigen isoform X2 [Silurus meridionalis]